MSFDARVPASLTYAGHPDTPVELRIRQHAAADRLRRAFIVGGTCFGAAIAAVFLPVLHFILVPSLLIATPFVFAGRLHESVTVLGGRGGCPACGHEQELAVRGALRPRTSLRCDGCGRELVLVTSLPVATATGSART